MSKERGAGHLVDPTKLVIVYIGHATLFINFHGTTILTDPVFSNRVGAIVKRRIEPGLKIEELPALDYVLVSHAHLDHFDRPSLRKLAHMTKTLIISKNCGDLVEGLGFKNIFEVHWGDTYPPSSRSTGEDKVEGDLNILAFKPQHWGTRMPWETARRGYNSYVISKNGRNILFGGDSGYTKVFEEISKLYPIDIIMLPITAYNPPEFRVMHMSPEDAIKVFEEIHPHTTTPFGVGARAKYLIPIHWGVFRLSLEPMDEPPRLMREIMEQRGLTRKLKLLQPGQLFSPPARERVGVR